MRVSGGEERECHRVSRQKLQQTASNFPDVKMATGNVKFLRGGENALAHIVGEIGKQVGREGQQHV
jgi:hypothetical protein